MIFRFREVYPIERLCELMGVSRSGYYKWLNRQKSPDKDSGTAALIQECHAKTRKTYGYRRVKIWLLRETGLIINHKAVLRIMRKYDMLAYRRKKRFRKYELDTFHRYDNLLDRDFTADRPNQKWATDISHIATSQGILYLSVIKDMYDGSIVAYNYATDQTTRLVLFTVREAMKKSEITGSVQLHSDQGCQYTSIAYNRLTLSCGIEPSMSRRGDPYDNASVENFFGMLKTECIYRVKLKTIDEAKELIDDYMYFYNYERIQLKSGMTPMEKRFLI